MTRRAAVVLSVALAACATGRERLPPREGDGPADGTAAPADAPRDLLPWRDLRATDRTSTAPDRTLAPDQAKTCPDSHEPNEACASAATAGTVVEGSGPAVLSATLDPAADQDWFSGTGLEDTHTCFPFTSQCYVLKVQVQVPAGRSFRLCLLEESCTAAATCVDNQGQPGPRTLEVQRKVDGTCALNDDLHVKISVVPVDTQPSCTSYSLSFRYDEC